MMETRQQKALPALEGAAGRKATSPESDAGSKRKRQPRNSACQGCAALKMKCIATANGKCERCNRMGRECIPAVPKPRTKRRASGGRSKQSYQSVPLSSLLDGEPGVVDRRNGDGLGTLAPHRTPKLDSHFEDQSLPPRHDSAHTDGKPFVSLMTQGLGNVAACDELLDGIDYQFVADSFAVFRNISRHFPFVELSSNTDVTSMVTRRPLSTVAICTVATCSRPEAQDRLSQAFRYAISSKVLLGGERGVDLLIGLLVYLAWNHHYMSQQQIYQQLYLLSGMSADLGLHQSKLRHTDMASSIELDRAFVGCYYLCSQLSATGFDRPNPFRWTENLHRCAENVARNGTLPTDRVIRSTLELAHAMDSFEETLRSITETRHHNAHHYIELYTNAASSRLKALKREFPAVNGSLAYEAAILHVHYKHMRHSEISSPSASIQCACAIKEYLDDILSRPPSTLHQLSIVDWANFLEALILMARVARPTSYSTGWETGTLVSMLNPDGVLDAICSHMASAPSGDTTSPRNEALLLNLRGICDGIKTCIVPEAISSASSDKHYDPTLEARFRPVNPSKGSHRPRALSYASEARSLDLNIFDSLSNGILDEDFWRHLRYRV